MSKAVTNEEVEDVLSSIRRLVSEDKRPLAGLRSAPSVEPQVEEAVAENPEETLVESGADEAASHASLDAGNDEVVHFVLTPALRITPTDDDTGERAEEVSEEEASEEGSNEDGPLDLASVARQTWTHDPEDSSAEEEDSPETAEDNVAAVHVPDAEASDQDAAMDALDALVHEAIENEGKAIEDSIDDGTDGADDPIRDDGASDEALADHGQSPEHSDNAHSAERDDPAEPDLNWNAEEAADDHEAEVKERDFEDHSVEGIHSDDQPSEDISSDVADTVFEKAPEPETENGTAQSSAYIPLTAKFAALQAAIGGGNQDYEPDGDEAQELAAHDAPAMAWEDDVELDGTGEPLQDAAEPVEEAQDATPDMATRPSEGQADDQVIDEAALRELVSEIVRSELQGALGERITRNVRKLVRREIHRALTAQDME